MFTTFQILPTNLVNNLRRNWRCSKPLSLQQCLHSVIKQTENVHTKQFLFPQQQKCLISKLVYGMACTTIVWDVKKVPMLEKSISFDRMQTVQWLSFNSHYDIISMSNFQKLTTGYSTVIRVLFGSYYRK